MAVVYVWGNRCTFGSTPQLGCKVGNMKRLLVNMLLGADTQPLNAASRRWLRAGQRQRWASQDALNSEVYEFRSSCLNKAAIALSSVT